MRYVIFNADDYGLRPHINEAIIETHKDGLLTSTTVMTTHVSGEAVLETKKNPNLGLGLHLNLTSGEPISKNWKEKYGNFGRPKIYEPGQYDREVLFEYYSKFDTEDVFKEYEAQYMKFVELFDKEPTHIDSHFYSAGSPTTFPAFLELAKKYKLKARPAAQFSPREKQKYFLGDFEPMDEYIQQAKDSGIVMPEKYSSVHPYRYPNYKELIVNEILSIKDEGVIEFAVHPGKIQDWRPEDIAKAPDQRVVNSRLIDREILLDLELKNTLDSMGVKLINYSEF